MVKKAAKIKRQPNPARRADWILLSHPEINILSGSVFPEKFIAHFTLVVKKICLWMLPIA
jgi:hypothetical protein